MDSILRQRTPWLAAVFFFSGLAGLIYQVAWQRLLTVHYGVGAVSITLIVSATMLGLGLGSLIGGRLAECSEDPCALYSAVEAALGVTGLLSFPLILALGRLTSSGPPAVSFISLFIFLCVPTILMGITLPLLATIFTRLTGEFVHSLCRLYFINTLGAAFGAVLTSYVLISLLGLDGCIFLAAAVNSALAIVILWVRRTPRQAAPAVSAEGAAPGNHGALGHPAYILVFVSGFIAIGCEIVWYRVIGTLVKDSPYAFSSILAVYLLGIALGSLGIHRYLARKPEASRLNLFFTAQFLIGLTVLLTFTGYYHLSQWAPVRWLTHSSFSMDLHPSLALFTGSPELPPFEAAYLLLDVFLWPLAFLLVPTLLMGASFPLISSLALSHPGGEGPAVGTTYFFGVIGNLTGGLLTGLALLPVFGTENTVLIFGSLGLLFGMAPRPLGNGQMPGFYRIAGVLILILGGMAVFPRPGELYEAIHEAPFIPRSVRFEEGLDAVVLTYENGDSFRNFINGQGHGYRPGPLFYAETVEALSFAPSPLQVLVIGFGGGSGTEAALILPEVQRVTVVELCRSAITNLRKFPLFENILDDKRIELVVDDGRRFLQRTGARFDVILMDPLRTTTAYSNNLHSRQFFALAANHLAPGGILMVGGVGDSPVIPRTLLEEFEHVRSYPHFSVASKAPLSRNPERFDLLLRPFPAEMQASIRAFTQNALEGTALAAATSGYPANQDWRPVSEYYLGLQLRQWLGKD